MVLYTVGIGYSGNNDYYMYSILTSREVGVKIENIMVKSFIHPFTTPGTGKTYASAFAMREL